MDEFNSGEQYYQEHLLLHAFKSNKAGIWSPFVSPFASISTVFTLGQEEEKIHLWTPSEPKKLDWKLPEGKDPCLSCFPHGLEYNTGAQLWRKNKDNRIGSKAVTLPDISCFYVNAMTPCNFFPLNKTNFSKIKKKKNHMYLGTFFILIHTPE